MHFCAQLFSAQYCWDTCSPIICHNDELSLTSSLWQQNYGILHALIYVGAHFMITAIKAGHWWLKFNGDYEFILPQVLQSLTIAIISELIYYTNGHSRVWLTSMNIDSNCHAYLLYYSIFQGLHLIIFSYVMEKSKFT